MTKQNQFHKSEKKTKDRLLEFVETAIQKINPTSVVPNERFNLENMTADLLITELYRNCIVYLINSGNVYDLQQFRKDFDELMESCDMKSKMKVVLQIPELAKKEYFRRQSNSKIKQKDSKNPTT